MHPTKKKSSIVFFCEFRLKKFIKWRKHFFFVRFKWQWINLHTTVTSSYTSPVTMLCHAMSTWMHINFHWVYLSFPFHLLHLLFIVYFNCLTITLKSLHFFFAQVFSQFSSRHANFNFDIFSIECLPWVFSWIMVMKWHLLNKHLDKFTFNLDGVLFVCFCSMIMCCFFLFFQFSSLGSDNADLANS